MRLSTWLLIFYIVFAGHALHASSEESGLSVTLSIKGMVCEGCVAIVTETLQSIDGVGAVRVDLAAEEAFVQYDPRRASEEAMVRALSDLGYTVSVPEVKSD